MPIRSLLHAALAPLLLSLVGCATTGTVWSGPPRTLVEVNRALDRREALVVLTDSTEVIGREITVAADSVRFRADRSWQAVSTDTVQRITFERKGFSPLTGAVGGALFGAGLIASCYLSDESGFLCLEVRTIFMVGAALAGAGFGILERTGEQERVAYEVPLSRYVGTRD